jgi:hypothetical protein
MRARDRCLLNVILGSAWRLTHAIRWVDIERVIQQSEANMSTGNYAMVNKHPIYYEQFGIGRPVVLLYGGASYNSSLI